MVNAASNPGSERPRAVRAGHSPKRQAVFAAYAAVVLLGILFGIPAAAVDVLLICSVCFAFGLAVIALLATNMKELRSYPGLVMLATCLHLAATVTVCRRVVLNEGQAGMVAGMLGSQLAELSGFISAVIFMLIAALSLAVVVGAARHIRTKAALNITVLAAGMAGQDKDTAARVVFNMGMGWAAKYLVMDAVTSVLMLCIGVGGAGVVAAMQTLAAGTEGAGAVATAVGAGIVTLLPVTMLAIAATWLMNREFIVCRGDVRQAEAKVRTPHEPRQKPETQVPAAREAVFDEPSSVRAEREYQRIADMLLDGQARDVKVILMAARNSAEMGVTLPVNVAAKIAQRKRRCLIVDMDITRDAVAKAFDTIGRDGPAKTCIRGLYVWGAASFCDTNVSIVKKLEAAQKHFEKVVIYWPGAGQGYEDIVQGVGAAILYGKKGVEMAVLEARLSKRGCLLLL
jgi:hypothetical protein